MGERAREPVFFEEAEEELEPEPATGKRGNRRAAHGCWQRTLG